MTDLTQHDITIWSKAVIKVLGPNKVKQIMKAKNKSMLEKLMEIQHQVNNKVFGKW